MVLSFLVTQSDFRYESWLYTYVLEVTDLLDDAALLATSDGLFTGATCQD